MTARAQQLWTGAEDRVLDWHWGEESPGRTAGRVGRTVTALRRRLEQRDIEGGGTGSAAAFRGRLTFQQLADNTGYTWHQIRRGAQGSGVKVLRTGSVKRGRRNLLTEEQADKVIAWLCQDPTSAGWTIPELAELAGVSRRWAYECAEDLGIRPGADHRLAAADFARLWCDLT